MWETLGGVGCFLGGLAAWTALFSPWAKKRKNNKKIREEREWQVHQALYGHAAVYDNSQSLIKDAQPGLLADMREVKGDVKCLKDRLDSLDNPK